MSIPFVNAPAGIAGGMQAVNSPGAALKNAARSMAGARVTLPAACGPAPSFGASRGRVGAARSRQVVPAIAGDVEGMGWVETTNGARVKYRNAMAPRSPSPPPQPSASAGSSDRTSKWTAASSTSKWANISSKWDAAATSMAAEPVAAATTAESDAPSPSPTDPRYNGGVVQGFHNQVAHVAASHAQSSQPAYQAASYAQASQAAFASSVQEAVPSQAAQVTASHASNIVPTHSSHSSNPQRAAAIAQASGGAVESVPPVVPAGSEGASTKVNQDVLELAIRENPAIRRIMDIEAAAVKAKSYVVAERAEKAVARLAEISQELRAAKAREVEAGNERDYATAMTSKNLVDILEKESTELAAHDYWAGDLKGFPFTKKSAKDSACGVPVRFRIPMQVDFGMSVFVVGSGDELGNWDAEHAVPMQWTQDGWQAEMMLPMGQRVEFKFIQREQVEAGDGKMVWGDAIWQDDPNRVVSLPFGGVKTVDIQSSWELDPEQEQVILADAPETLNASGKTGEVSHQWDLDSEQKQVWTCTALENTGKTGAKEGNQNGNQNGHDN